jgi:two-component system sensor histidine kinase PilS (NtrC family)
VLATRSAGTGGLQVDLGSWNRDAAVHVQPRHAPHTWRSVIHTAMHVDRPDPVSPSPGPSHDSGRSLLDRRRFVRWIYVGRLTVATAIFIAAVANWSDATENTLIATIAFAAAFGFTGWSLWHTRVRARPMTTTFLAGQALFDVLLVTIVVHLTGARELSPLAPLYIVVNTSAALLLPIGGSILLAFLGSALYAADVFFLSDAAISVGLLTQLSVFIAAAIATAVISSRLQQSATVAALTQARLEAEDILNNIRSGILTVDANGSLLYANPAASDLLGIALNPTPGARVLADIERIAPGLARALTRTMTERQPIRRGETTVTLTNREFPIGLTTTFNAGNGDRNETHSTTAIFQDISDQKRLDILKSRTARLEAVAGLSASLAHEIRNPLASIQSAVKQLGQSPRSTPDEQTLTRLIVRESDRLTRLLSEFLDFARPTAAKLRPMDVAATVRGAARLAAAHPSRGKHVDVACTFGDEPVMIHGDEDLLHRAVFNLVLNAVQAVEERGSVRVELRGATRAEIPSILLAGGDEVIALRVIDDGPGIDPAIRDRLFEPFATTREGGSGLGLAVAHRAVEAHGGVVMVDTGERGSRFTIFLPRATTP